MPVVFSSNFEYLKGKEAWRSNLHLTAMAADRIRSSYGPNGAYKMVTYNRGPEKICKVTKDAVAVLEELAVQYPTLVVLSEAAKLQRQEHADGVKGFILLTAALLRKADELISRGVHPNVILAGYEKAAIKALQTIDRTSQEMSLAEVENVLDAVDCGRGCLTPGIRAMILEAAKNANRDGKLDKDRIRVVRKPGGAQLETTLVRGLVVKKAKAHPNMPDQIEKPRIAVTSERIGANRLEVKMPSQGPFHMKFAVTKPEDLTGCREAENKRKAENLRKLSELDVNVLFCQQPIDCYSRAKLQANGVLAFESVDRSDLMLIAKATGAKVVGPLADLESSDIGAAEKLDLDKIGLEKTATLTGCDYATFLVGGSNLQALEELELLIQNSLTTLQAFKSSGKVLVGGGATDMLVARELEAFALQFAGKEQLAVDAFAEALLELPLCAAANCGLNPGNAVAELKQLHSDGFSDFGLCIDGSVGKACVEVSGAKRAAVWRAFEVASLMLRVDEQIKAKKIPKFHKQ